MSFQLLQGARPAMRCDVVAARAGHYGQGSDAASYEPWLPGFAAAKHAVHALAQHVYQPVTGPDHKLDVWVARTKFPQSWKNEHGCQAGLHVDAQTALRYCRSRAEL